MGADRRAVNAGWVARPEGAAQTEGMRAWPLPTAVLALLLGCPRAEEAAPSLIAAAERTAAADQRPTRVRGGVLSPQRYAKREGLHIDVPYLAGRSWDQVDADAIADQLGVELSRESLGPGEEHVVYDKAEIWLYRDRIYRVYKPLVHPMDIPTALGTSGFPLSLGAPIDATREVRWNRAWGLRRLRLLKDSDGGRDFIALDAVKFLPSELR